MKKLPNMVVYVLFTLGYVAFLSLGMACLTLAFGYGMANSFEGPSYPYFEPFCVIVGLFATVALLALLFVNWIVAEDYAYTTEGWLLQAIIVLVLSFILTRPWMMLLELLHRIF